MGVVSGDLRLVTARAARASEVIVRARDLHTQSGAVVLTAGDRVPVQDGQVSFTCLPGAAVMVVVVDGRPTESVPLLVPDGDIGLADAVAAALALDDATFSELEALAVRVAAGVAGVEADLGSVRELKQAAETAAAETVRRADEASAASAAAKQSQDAAAVSASAASQAAQAAKESQDAAAGSASAASSSASAASSSATAARNSQTAASSAQQAAVASQQAAKQSQDAARASELAAAESAAQAADVAAAGVPDATGDTKGKVRLAGDLGGTADSPTVPGLADKANASHIHSQADVAGLSAALEGKANTSHTHTLSQITNAPNFHTSAAALHSLMSRDANGRSQVNAPVAEADIANKAYVDSAVAGVQVDTSGLVTQAETSTTGTPNTVVKRDAAGQVATALTPTLAGHATSKSYVDAQVATVASRFSLDTQGSVNTGGGTIRWWRRGDVVTVHVGNVSVGTSYSALPSTVRPPVDVDFFLTGISNRGAVRWATITAAGVVSVNAPSTVTGACFGVVTYCV